jgi:hypothetical protein
MSLLKDFETRLEKIVEGVFQKGFKSTIQPIELAKRLVRSMEEGRTVSVNKVYVPNQYTIRLSKEDIEEFTSFEPQLISELKDFLMKHMKSRRYATIGDIKIMLEEDKDLALGENRIEAKLVTPSGGDKPEGEIMAALDLSVGDEQETFFLTKRTVRIGRLENNDIIIPDPSLSRHHVEIKQSEGKFHLYDLGSTNGTFLNGRRVSEASLKNGDSISVGKVDLKFRRLG